MILQLKASDVEVVMTMGLEEARVVEKALGDVTETEHPGTRRIWETLHLALLRADKMVAKS